MLCATTQRNIDFKLFLKYRKNKKEDHDAIHKTRRTQTL